MKAVIQLAIVLELKLDTGMIFKILGYGEKQDDKITNDLLSEEQIYQSNECSNWYHFRYALVVVR